MLRLTTLTETHTKTHIFGRIPVDEGSVSRNAKHSQEKHPCLRRDFELALPAKKLPQTYALYRAANGNGDCAVTSLKVTGWDEKLTLEK